MFLGGMAEITANPVPQSVAEPTPLATPIVLKPEPPRHSKRYRWAHDVPVSLGTTLDGLILARVIDQGAFGTIYEALDMANVKTFAVKVEKSISKPKFLMTEAKVYRRLQAKPDLTAHICPMYRWCKRDTIHYLVLAYLGKNLELLKLDTEDQRFSPGTVAEIGQQCLQAIKATHTVGYVHRDIKPTNFAIGRQLVQMNQIFLLDFGLAKSYRHRDGRLRSPRFLASDAGTARYWSIRAHSGGEVGRSDDLWSLFYMLLEFILGSLPWENQDDKEIILQCKQALQPWLESRPEVPATLKTILAYLGTLGLMHEPEYDQLHKWLQEMKVANNFTQLDWAIPTDFK